MQEVIDKAVAGEPEAANTGIRHYTGSIKFFTQKTGASDTKLAPVWCR